MSLGFYSEFNFPSRFFTWSQVPSWASRCIPRGSPAADVAVCAGSQGLLSGAICLIFCSLLLQESGESGKEQVVAGCISQGPKIGGCDEREELQETHS